MAKHLSKDSTSGALLKTASGHLSHCPAYSACSQLPTPAVGNSLLEFYDYVGEFPFCSSGYYMPTNSVYDSDGRCFTNICIADGCDGACNGIVHPRFHGSLGCSGTTLELGALQYQGLSGYTINICWEGAGGKYCTMITFSTWAVRGLQNNPFHKDVSCFGDDPLIFTEQDAVYPENIYTQYSTWDYLAGCSYADCSPCYWFEGCPPSGECIKSSSDNDVAGCSIVLSGYNH